MAVPEQNSEALSSPVQTDSAPGSVSGGAAANDALLPRRRSLPLVWLRDVLISVASSVLIITFFYQPVRVEGTSMLPRLENHDRLFINKFVYHFEAIQRGDVIVFHYPRDPRLSYIKRVIAIPGDRVEIENGQVYVNDEPLNEPYVPEQYRDTRSMQPEIVQPGEYFVLGDHRSIASDSRDFGLVPRRLIYGKAEFVYWPRRDAGFVR